MRTYSQELPACFAAVLKLHGQVEEIHTRLADNGFFMCLEPNERKKFLSGRSVYMSSLEDIAARAGVDLQTFRWLYQVLSNQIHGLPMSFFRMAEQNRGRGVRSETEEMYISLCIPLAVALLHSSREEMQELFSETKNI